MIRRLRQKFCHHAYGRIRKYQLSTVSEFSARCIKCGHFRRERFLHLTYDERKQRIKEMKL